MKNGIQSDFLEELIGYSNPDLVKMDQEKLTKISEQYLNHFQLLINQKRGQISYSNVKDGVILLGYTGSGKTTLINYLNGIYGRIDKSGLIDFNNIENALPVSKADSYSSCTFLPQIKLGDNKLFLDCPGTKDNRGFFVNLCNGLTVKNMVNSLKTIKLCLVVEFAALELAKGNWFLQSIKENVLTIIQEGYESNVSLIISKVPSEFDLENIKNKIGDVKCDNLQVKHFIENIITNNKIAIFSNPVLEKDGHNVGGVYFNELVNSQMKSLEQLIENNTNSFDAHNLKSWAIDQDVLYSIFEAYKNTLRIDENLLKTQYLEKIYRLSSDIGRSNLKQDIENKIIQIRSLKKKDGKFETIKEQLSILGCEEKIKNLSILEPFLHGKACQEGLQRKICGDLNQIEGNLIAIYSYIEDYNIRTIDSKDNEKIIYGNFINANKVLGESYDKIKSIKLYATNYVTVSESIKLNGINLTVVTPNLSVENSISINLSGENGRNHDIQKAFNSDGLPGKPGQSAGNFLAIYNRAYNLELLKISLYGGKGGNGQDGADGRNGKNGVNGKDFLIANFNNTITYDLEGNITARLLNNDYQIKELLFNVNFVNQYQESITHTIQNQLINCCCCIPKYIIKNHTFLVRGTTGQEGENAFKGGQKGNNGFSGNLTIINKDIKDINVFRDKDINHFTGQNGKYGVPGKGGVNGENYAIQYKIPEDYYNRDCSVIDFLTCGISKLSVNLLTRNMENSRTQRELKTESTELGARYVGGNQNQSDGYIPNQLNKMGLLVAEKNEFIDKEVTLREYEKLLSSDDHLSVVDNYCKYFLYPFIEESLAISGNSIDYSCE